MGHTVRLMPPHYVKPYIKRGKTDAADAEAIAEAVTRPTMRLVGIKTVEQCTSSVTCADPPQAPCSGQSFLSNRYRRRVLQQRAKPLMCSYTVLRAIPRSLAVLVALWCSLI